MVHTATTPGPGVTHHTCRTGIVRRRWREASRLCPLQAILACNGMAAGKARNAASKEHPMRLGRLGIAWRPIRWMSTGVLCLRMVSGTSLFPFDPCVFVGAEPIGRNRLLIQSPLKRLALAVCQG
jgi:hypothetical protein